MSRLGKMLLQIPKGVNVDVKENQIKIKGPKGELSYQLEKGVMAKIEDGKIRISIQDPSSEEEKTLHGLYWSMIRNALLGVSQGYEKRLTMIGVGYKAALKGNSVDLKVGASHPIELAIPKGIQVVIDKGIDIVLTGCDKQKIGQFAADLRAKKPPEPYKGKGIRYVGEYVRKKAGKAAAVAAKGAGGPAK